MNFHGDDVRPSPPEKALFHVIAAPMEQSVSYGVGAARGPAAIISASRQLELLTDYGVPADHGIYTAAVDCQGDTAAALARIEEAVAYTCGLGKIPALLGGEHTVTLGAIRALKKFHSHFGVIHFDAHADLRDRYEGSPSSHACVMRRVHELGVPLFQIATRAYSLEEQKYRQENTTSLAFVDARDLSGQANLVLPAFIPEEIYISFDVDAFDTAVMPATGTPVPGGLSWWRAMDLLEQIMANRHCIGLDVVELAPIAGLHFADFTAAQLVYNLMALTAQSGTADQLTLSRGSDWHNRAATFDDLNQ
ncbi:MAG: agmatinase [Desulfobulbaceae bacterium]|jgi:agmatinase|nr:agmatinase [Desulfobulbaceae bacterium]